MDVLQNLAFGLQTALSLDNLFYCFIGTLLGTLVGVLPGVGPTATIAILLPVTFSLPPDSALIMLAGIYYGSQYGGSTTAILINLPGEAASAVTAIDGYQMARNGRAGPALAIAALGSFFAGTVATFVIAYFAGPLTALALKFHPADFCSLMVLGLGCAIVLAHGSMLKAVAMVLLGLLLGLVGTDISSGAQRFTLGHLELADGLDVVALAVGMFGIAEIFRNLENERRRDVMQGEIGRLMPSRQELRAAAAPVVRGTFIGSLLGILPGGGALLSSFASYALEKRISRTPERFGKGAVEGVAGPESANNAGAQTSFIPMLTLGIPSNAVMALMIGAMIIQGVVPGPNVVTQQPKLFWGLIASMWIGNAMLLFLNLPLIGLWVKMLKIPYSVLFPAIIAFSSIGVYTVSGNPFHLYTVAFFGVLSYLLVKLDCEPTPLLLGFVLGPLFEDNLRQALILSRGDPTVFVTRPISATLLAAMVITVAVMSLPSLARKRKEVFTED